MARTALKCVQTPADNLFEEVEPAVILKDRKNENGTRDFLVKWADGEEDTWVGHLLTHSDSLSNAMISQRPCR